MVRRRLGVLAPVLFVGFALAISAPASAESKGKPRPVAIKKPAKPAKAPKKEEAKAEAKPEEPAAAEEKAPEVPDKGEASSVKAAGTANATKAQSTGNAVTVKETKEGVKTYKFGAIEVEGRSKSPEIIYFLRRVRAEFDASALGHRSFMRELSDTRNRPSFR